MPQESLAARKKRLARINAILARTCPEAKTALAHRSPLQLLVATILSAQCTDERVNAVTETLFKKYESAADYVAVDQAELEADIRPTGFFRNKAKSIQGCCRALLETHGGRVPQTMDELVALPGIGRKTANVVLGAAFGIASGVVVDTHVRRLAKRLKLTNKDDPVKIEADLIKVLPKDEWIDFSHRFIFHGQQICRARTPKCGACPIAELCPSRRQ